MNNHSFYKAQSIKFNSKHTHMRKICIVSHFSKIGLFKNITDMFIENELFVACLLFEIRLIFLPKGL